MPSRRAFVLRGCKGKRKLTREQAAQSARAVNTLERAPRRRVEAYKCTRCGSWHIGHTERDTWEDDA